MMGADGRQRRRVASSPEKLGAAMALAIAVGGCTLVSGNTVVVPGHAEAAGPRVVRVLVAAGRQSRLERGFSLNPDCSTVGYFTYRVLTAPQHGTVSSAIEPSYPDFPAGSLRAACDLHPTPGAAFFYTPLPSYVGPDTVTVLNVRPNGTAFEVTFAIEVR